MKKQILAIFAVVLMASTFVSTAHAELFSVSAGMPLSYENADIADSSGVETDGMPKGLLVHVKLPIMVGVGLEEYSQGYKLTNDDTFTVSTTMYDVFYLLPIPIINVTLGVGAGTASVQSDDISQYDGAKANIWQYYGQLGFPILGVVDLHVSYHKISGQNIEFDTGWGELETAAEMYALGISIGF